MKTLLIIFIGIIFCMASIMVNLNLERQKAIKLNSPLPKPIAITKTTNKVDGKPWDEEEIHVISGENYGREPYITVHPNPDNTVTIAWLEQETRKIKISEFDKDDSLKKEIICKNMQEKRTSLLGFTKISATNQMLIGYEKFNSIKDASEFWIMLTNENGDSIWTRKIFGGKSMKEQGAKCCPASGGTARLVYNPKTRNFGFFLAHNQKWSDGIHQASYLGFMNLAGQRLKAGNQWYISHDFDQRMMVVDSLYYLLSHGDAYPRSLVFSVWTDSEKALKNNLVFTEYFKIPGETGENYTNSHTGGFVYLSDGNFGIVFSTGIGRKRQDICYMKISKNGKILLTKWITQNTDNDAKIPKIANRGKNRVLLAWQSDWKSKAFYEIDNNGNILAKKIIVKSWEDSNTDIRLCMTHDFVTCPNGDIVWSSGDYRNNQLIIYRIKF